MLHVYPGQTLMFSFCWTKSVVSTAGNAVTLFINLAGNPYKSFHTVIFISAVRMLRCYNLPTCNQLSICISCFTGHFRIHCYDVTLLHIAYRSNLLSMLRCYAVTHCLPETWLSICISLFIRSFSYPMLRCYDVTLLHIAYLRHGC